MEQKLDQSKPSGLCSLAPGPGLPRAGQPGAPWVPTHGAGASESARSSDNARGQLLLLPWPPRRHPGTRLSPSGGPWALTPPSPAHRASLVISKERLPCVAAPVGSV